MGRYDAPTGIEGEYEPGSRGRVLRNMKGVNRVREIDELEGSALLDAQESFADKVTARTPFSVYLICEMHRLWLGKLYEWAGRYRTVEMSKGGFTWPPAQRVVENMIEFEAKVLKRLTPCAPGELRTVALATAEVQAELLLIHPFREGNGRLSRWLCDLLVQQAGLPGIRYGFQGKGSGRVHKRYLMAVQRGYAGDYLPLADFLEEGLRAAILEAENLIPRAPSK